MIETPAATTASSPMNVTNRLAYERTYLALERTMQAWIRTALSLITFGFTVNKFFQYLGDKTDLEKIPHLVGPRYFGLGLLVIGLLTLFIATAQHAASLAAMRREYPETPRSLAALVALLLSLLGIFAIVTALTR